MRIKQCKILMAILLLLSWLVIKWGRPGIRSLVPLLPDTDDPDFLSILERIVNLCSFPSKQQATVGTGEKKKNKWEKKKGERKSFPSFSGAFYGAFFYY